MTQKLLCNLNGIIVESEKSPYTSADDSFRLRYGLYETFLFREGELMYESLHWQRLFEGMDTLGFQLFKGSLLPVFQQQVFKLAHQMGLEKLARIRFQVFSDTPDTPFIPQFLIECFSIEEATCEWLSEGITIGLLGDFYKKKSLSNNCKISHNAHFLLARDMMLDSKLDDVLLQNEEGNIIESAIANLFWVKGDTVFTPPLSDGCVAGTMRKIILDVLLVNAIPFKERSVTYEDLKSADEIFLTNSIRKIRWVREWDKMQFCNIIARKLFNFLGVKA